MDLSAAEQELATQLGWNPDILKGIKGIIQVPLYHLRLSRDGYLSRRGPSLQAMQLDGVFGIVESSQVHSLVEQLRPYVINHGMQPYHFDQRDGRMEDLGYWNELRNDWRHKLVGVLPYCDPYEIISLFLTAGPNWDLQHDDLMRVLRHWESQCHFHVAGAGREWIELAFDALPDDVERLATEAYDICWSMAREYEEAFPHLYDDYEDYEAYDAAQRAYAISCIAECILQTRFLAMWWI